MLFNYFNGERTEVYIDLDTGMQRTGLTIDKVPDLVEEIKHLNGLTIGGIHCYDGHVQNGFESVWMGLDGRPESV